MLLNLLSKFIKIFFLVHNCSFRTSSVKEGRITSENILSNFFPQNWDVQISGADGTFIFFYDCELLSIFSNIDRIYITPIILH
jgi:hypothetical protein